MTGRCFSTQLVERCSGSLSFQRVSRCTDTSVRFTAQSSPTARPNRKLRALRLSYRLNRLLNLYPVSRMCFRDGSGNDSGCRSTLDVDYHHFTNHFSGHRRSVAFDFAGRDWFVPIPPGHVHESSGIFCPLRLRTKSATAITVALKAGCTSPCLFLSVNSSKH